MDHGASEIMKWIILTLVISTILTIGIMVFRFGRLSSFQQSASNILQANGGLTKEADKSLKRLSKDYHNTFIVTSADDNSKEMQGFGKPIHYQIHTNIPIMVLSGNQDNKGSSLKRSVLTSNVQASTTSQVGQD